MPLVIDLDVELAKKKVGVSELAAAIDITPANVSVLKNGRAKAIRFSTLDARRSTRSAGFRNVNPATSFAGCQTPTMCARKRPPPPLARAPSNLAFE